MLKMVNFEIISDAILYVEMRDAHYRHDKDDA